MKIQQRKFLSAEADKFKWKNLMRIPKIKTKWERSDASSIFQRIQPKQKRNEALETMNYEEMGQERWSDRIGGQEAEQLMKRNSPTLRRIINHAPDAKQLPQSISWQIDDLISIWKMIFAQNSSIISTLTVIKYLRMGCWSMSTHTWMPPNQMNKQRDVTSHLIRHSIDERRQYRSRGRSDAKAFLHRLRIDSPRYLINCCRNVR